jgi:hypothetical protein
VKGVVAGAELLLLPLLACAEANLGACDSQHEKLLYNYVVMQATYMLGYMKYP